MAAVKRCSPECVTKATAALNECAVLNSPCSAFNDQLQDQGVEAVRFLKPVNRGDFRMVQRGEDLRFALEAGKPVGIVREQLGQHLQRDVAIEPRVPRSVHLPHPAGTHDGNNLVRADPRAGSEVHCRGVGGLYAQSPTVLRGESVTAELCRTVLGSFSPALSTCRGPPPKAAPEKTPIKLGCGSGPLAPKRARPSRPSSGAHRSPPSSRLSADTSRPTRKAARADGRESSRGYCFLLPTRISNPLGATSLSPRSPASCCAVSNVRPSTPEFCTASMTSTRRA